VKNTPLDKVLRTLASESNKSLVFGDEVKGSVSISVKDLEYEKAIDAILRPTTYRAEHSKDATIIRTVKDSRGFRQFRLNYIDASTIKANLVDIAKDAQITVDPFTNSVFVVDAVESLNYMEKVIHTVDKLPRQVEVEAAIADVEHSDGFDSGTNFATSVHNLRNGRDPIVNDISGTRISPFDQNAPSNKGFFVGLSWDSVNLIIGLLKQKTKLTLLARPRIVALNDTEAKIVIGGQLGYKTKIFAGQGQVMEDVKFLTVGTQLTIKPHITENDDIVMYIRPEISDGSLDQQTQVPTTKTTNTETKVVAKNGQTIVLGGLLRDRTELVETKIPVLADLPFIGFLFRGKQETSGKSEIVIMLSPRIIDPQAITSFEKEGHNMLKNVYKERLDLSPPPERYSGD
jgi:type II secretory pathway component GspD/PulD (secretin)